MDKDKLLLVGICGGIASGKSTVQKFFVDKGFRALNFADTLKQCASILNLTKREELQRLGDGFRLLYGNDFWIKQLNYAIMDLNYIGRKRFVIGDVRYPNEYDFIKSRYNGIIIGLSISKEVRRQRIIKRNDERDKEIRDYTSFEIASKHPSELNVDFIVPRCDIIMDTSQPLNTIKEQLNDIYDKIAKKWKDANDI